MAAEAIKDEIRVGVFVCDCGLNIAGAVDCGAVTEYAETLPDVVCAVRNKYTCADPGQNEIKDAIREHKLNRVVVASCTPRQHEPTFRQCVLEAGLNPYLMEMANLREHCSWVHPGTGTAATDKAKDLVARRSRGHVSCEPQEEMTVPVTQRGAGDRRRRGRHPGRPRARRRGARGLPGGEGAVHRGDHGPAGQDLPHHGLLDMNSRA